MEEVSSYWQIPSIAHFCKLFQNIFSLPNISYEELEIAFISKVSLGSDVFGSCENNVLRGIFVALLKNYFAPQTVNLLNWESYLYKIFQIQCPNSSPFVQLDGKELTFDELTIKQKVEVVYKLCEFCLYRDDICESLRDIEADDFRIEPLGTDSKGYVYWYFYGTRLYRENPNVASEIETKYKKIDEINRKIYELKKKEEERKREEEERKKQEEERKKQEEERKKEELERKKREKEEKKDKNPEAKKTKRGLPPKILGTRTGLRDRKSFVNGVCASPVKDNKNNKQDNNKDKNNKDKNNKDKNNNKKDNNKKDNKSKVKNTPTKQKPKENPIPPLPVITTEELKESWCVICKTQQDWVNLADKFKKSKSKCEIELYNLLTTNFVEQITEIFNKFEKEKQKEERQKLLELIPRRTSSRIEIKKIIKEQEEQETKKRKIEEESKKEEITEYKGLRIRDYRKEKESSKEKEQLHQEKLKQEREERAQKRLKLMEERAERYRNRELGLINGMQDAFNAELQYEDTTSSDLPITEFNHDDINNFVSSNNSEDEFYEKLEKVIASVIANRDSWPFREPVDEKEAPMYYQVIEQPIDLKTIENKIINRGYKELKEIELDFKLMVNNCETYNGPKNGYTLMAYAVWRAFKKAVKKHLDSELSLDDQSAFIYPPKPANTNIKPAIEAKKKKSRNKRRHSAQALHVLAQASEQAIKDTSSMSSIAASSPRSSFSIDDHTNDDFSLDNSCDNKPQLNSTTTSTTTPVYQNIILSNGNNVNNNIIPTLQTLKVSTSENLTFKSLDEWSRAIKQSGNSIILPQHAVIISSAPVTSMCTTNGPTVRLSDGQQRFVAINKVVQPNDASNSNRILIGMNNTQPTVLSNNSNDPKRLVIKLTKSETGEVWKPVQTINLQQNLNLNQPIVPQSVSSNIILTSNTVNVPTSQAVKNIPNYCVPVKKRVYIPSENPGGTLSTNFINVNSNEVIAQPQLAQSFQIPQFNQNSNGGIKIIAVQPTAMNIPLTTTNPSQNVVITSQCASNLNASLHPNSFNITGNKQK